MSDPTSNTVLIDTRVPDIGRAMQSAFLWVLASLVTAVAIFVITLLVWAQNEREAGRMIVGAQKTTGYLPVVASQYATLHGRPGSF
ncbi:MULTISPECIES: hypothetical protein [Methylobacterium]|uniref:Uncharacterized protein n=1 Tax=Methylobacterium thuringiense TaxID=1003091 RepID=A0ABQ4TK22_9HYPH|nr:MULTISPECIES: hypothetical protein [Methylobacterium]TXN21662.1 hypothetical protein FV217_13550 [Methylobacterium sp. WL9]GJE55679.1 hypothetical protein EKPJFOCH_2174 [Methylobacterium thuringiense]